MDAQPANLPGTGRCRRSGARPSVSVRRGFSLVELIIVVLLLAIIAGIVLPEFTSASTESRESALRGDL